MPLLGGSVDIVLYDAEEAHANSVFAQLQEEGLRLQRIFNVYDAHSELSALNRDRRIDAGAELREVLGAALSLSAQTGGRYDVTKGKQFLARKRGEPLTGVACSWRDVRVDGTHVTLLHPDAMIDLGSIAKGYIADRLVAFAHRLGIENVFVDARGDMRTSGSRLEVVDVQDPRDSGAKHRPFVLENAAVATSGDYKQYNRSFDESHIIGARGIASVTVVAPTTMLADGLATALCVVGIADGARLLGAYPQARAFIITAQGDQLLYNQFEQLEVQA
jgi:thiamine biosynthesis lipoprotein